MFEVYELKQTYKHHLRKSGLNEENVQFNLETLEAYRDYLKGVKETPETASVDEIKGYLSRLIEKGDNSTQRLTALYRYINYANQHDNSIYMAAVLGGRYVYGDMAEKLRKVAGEKVAEEVLKGFNPPPLGSPPEMYPAYSKDLVDRLHRHLPYEKVIEVLTGNYHRIPGAAFTEKKKRWKAAKTIEEFLAREHKHLCDELKKHMQEGTLWYEQEITSEVLEFVKSDPTIQNGVVKGNKVYKSKIPYDPVRYLKEKDPLMRRYYACHCPLARSAIKDGSVDVPMEFCYCSAGFEKLPWDVILGVPVEVKVLESALGGSDRCRFEITIPKDKLKR